MPEIIPYSLDGKSILVTGGTGSFGKVFVKKIYENYKPARVVIYSRDELKQFEMAQEINPPTIRYFIGDVRDQSRMELALRGIDLVVHAAALKQVPAAEYNPMEFIKTNVIGAENIINASIARGVGRVIALSTDKAVNPLNLYGATKLCSDKLLIAANNSSGLGGTRFSVVRYGNVIGSRGSVIPFFRQLASEGKKLPVTDERMTRFWITLDQGADFVMRRCCEMRGGEIFVPKCPSMKVTDLAKAISPDREIEVVGIRPGEKLHEILVPEDENRYTIEFKDMFVIKPAFRFWEKPDDEIPADQYGSESGKQVANGFEYRSNDNPDMISAEELRAIIN